MATDYTHAFVGVAIGRLYADRRMPWTYWGLATLLPTIPDLDVISTAAYGSAMGHRGITHSLVFALLLSGVAASLTFRRFRVKWWSLTALFFAMVASHGLLDACTRGGGNIPFFWPLGADYGNWGPLSVSDIAFDLPDPRRSRAISGELIWVWLPTAILLGLAWIYRRWQRHRGISASVGGS